MPVGDAQGALAGHQSGLGDRTAQGGRSAAEPCPVKAKTVLLTMLNAAFVAVGAWFLASPSAAAPEADRVVGWAAVTFFGGGMLIGLSMLIARRPPEPEPSGELVIRPWRPHAALQTLAAASMGTGCALMVPVGRTDGDVIAIAAGGAGASLACLAVVAGLWRLLRARPVLRIDTTGITVSGRRGWNASWGEILSIRVFRVSKLAMVGFAVSERVQARYPNRSRLDGRLGFPSYALNPSSTGLEPEKLEALVVEYWQRWR